MHSAPLLARAGPAAPAAKHLKLDGAATLNLLRVMRVGLAAAGRLLRGVARLALGGRALAVVAPHRDILRVVLAVDVGNGHGPGDRVRLGHLVAVQSALSAALASVDVRISFRAVHLFHQGLLHVLHALHRLIEQVFLHAFHRLHARHVHSLHWHGILVPICRGREAADERSFVLELEAVAPLVRRHVLRALAVLALPVVLLAPRFLAVTDGHVPVLVDRRVHLAVLPGRHGEVARVAMGNAPQRGRRLAPGMHEELHPDQRCRQSHPDRRHAHV
mmetsp:Transcript_47848/g.94772  ORF Transcript_47848/g.94772 Transcript_47848/m.94772 type:complete len:275 (-) Transcript_47848:74-898(-)